ncbi:hypothetical protein Bca52824_016791 [Brassica carinata]|uniref:Replication factor A C-terminal domain-containing protein n=1 Tax=Brassica carinata TaxID=52824 RepID=A0A8X7W7Q9_BRACI|nr:hypothetical protein Bca52824_016791 [Brassica carinata]
MVMSSNHSRSGPLLLYLLLRLVEPLTIAELNNFIITAPSQCSRKLQRTISSFTCARCANSHAVGALRYRVEMAIADDTAEGTFVWFDGVMTKLHNLRASDAPQMLGGVDDGDDKPVPVMV